MSIMARPASLGPPSLEKRWTTQAATGRVFFLHEY